MKPIFRNCKDKNKSTDGLKPFPKGDLEGGFIVARNYVMFEYQVPDIGYGDLFTCYIVPINKKQVYIMSYCPDLWYLKMKMNLDKQSYCDIILSNSKIADAMKNGKNSNNGAVFIRKAYSIEDEEPTDKDCWYIGCTVSLSISKSIFITDNFEFQEIKEAGVKIISLYNEVMSSLCQSFSVEDKFLRQLLLFQEKRSAPPFVTYRQNLHNIQAKELLGVHSIIFVGSSGKCYRPFELITEDTGEILLRAMKKNSDKFPQGADTEIIYRVKVNEDKLFFDMTGWIDSMSDMCGNVDKKNFVKIPEATYVNMPKTSQLFFYSNKYHDGVSLHRFMKDDDRERYYYDQDEVFFTVNGNFIVNTSYFNVKNLWNPSELLSLESSLGYTLNISFEVLRFIPIYIKGGWTDLIKYIAKKLLVGVYIGINPIGFLLKKILRNDKK